MFTDLTLPEDQQRQFQTQRTAAIIGPEIAENFGIKVGDKIPLMANIWPNKDNAVWEFDVVGIYDGEDPLCES